MKENRSIDDMFQRALEIEDRQLVDAFLMDACEGDDDLRKEVVSLLEAHFAADAFLNSPAEPLWAEMPVEREGDRIGRYRLLRKIGEGGFGVVYLAEQTEPVKRPVALKVIKAGMDSKEVIARFEAERQALALMDHPHIAKVLDAGTTDGGRPYFVMELVKGDPITKFCTARNLDTHARLALFTDVCAAVQHAHQKGVIHRDLKPSNILVSADDGKPVVKVIDFGIAKAIRMELTEKTIFTQLGRMIGTPQYMSPEQAEPNAVDIDTRSDIYSLGVVLYELLTGTTPLDGEQLRSAAYGEMQRRIREETPVKPSTRVGTSTRPASPGGASDFRSLRGDLDWIVMKALEKERSRRYETANGFAADVRRYLNQEPVTAGPPGIGYKMGKFVRRNRRSVAAAAVIVFLLVAGIFATSFFAVASRKAQQIAEERLRTIQGFQIGQAEEALESGDLPRGMTQLARILREDPSHPAAIERASECLFNHSFPLPQVVSMRHGEPIRSVQFSPDGLRLVTGSDDHTARIWDARTGAPLGEEMHHADRISSARFSPDGKCVVTASRDHTARIWDAETGLPLGAPLRHPDKVNSARFSRDGQKVVTACSDGFVRIWDVETGRPDRAPLETGGGARVAELSPDGTTLLTAGDDNDAVLWDVGTGRLIRRLVHQGRVSSARFSPDGMRVATGSLDHQARLWETLKGMPAGDPMRHEDEVHSVSFSEDGQFLVTASSDRTARVWDGRTGNQVGQPIHLTSEVTCAGFDPGGQRVLTGSSDGIARIWDIRPGQALREAGVPSPAAVPLEGFPISICFDDAAGGWKLKALPAPVPDWFAEWVESVAGRCANAQGVTELLPPEDVLKFGQRVKLSPDADFYTRAAQWFFADRAGRAISPWSAVSIPEHVRHLVENGTESSLREAVSLSPSNGPALAKLARLIEVRDPPSDPSLFREAAFLARQAVKWMPAGSEFRMPLAEAHLILGDAESALAAVDRETLSHPDSASAWLMRSDILKRLGRVEESAVAFARAIGAMKVGDLHPPLAGIAEHAALLAWFGKDADHAALCERMLQFPAAETADLAAAVSISACLRPDPDAAMQAEILARARRAADEEPESAWTQLSLGISECRSGNDPEAEAALSKAAALADQSPKDPGRLQILGIAGFYQVLSCIAHNRQSEARERFNRTEPFIKPLPAFDRFPYASGAGFNDLMLWLAYKEAAASLQITELRRSEPTITFQQGVDRGFGVYHSSSCVFFKPDPFFRGSSDLRVGRRNGELRSVLIFDHLFTDGPGGLPKGARIKTATLRLRVFNPGALPVFHQMAAAWDPATLTFENARLNGNNKPGIQIDGLEALREPVATAPHGHRGIVNIDVTASVRNWSNGQGNFGWLLSNQGDQWAAVGPGKKDRSARPELIITFEPPDSEQPPGGF